MGVEHGLLETLHGNVATGGLIIDAVGRQPGGVLQGSEPAMTLLPNFLATGIAAIIAGLCVALWAAVRIDREKGGPVLILLAGVLFLVGGGLAPLVIVAIACAVATRIRGPLSWWRRRLSGRVGDALARLWPWFFAVFFIASLLNLQVAIVGDLFGLDNAALAGVLPLTILVLLLASVAGGFARDIRRQPQAA
jgi:hypothetical protein